MLVGWLAVLLSAVACGWSARLAEPEATLVEEPADVLVSEGEEAVLKCRTDGPATRCKWRLNRTDNPYELVDVKEFYPKREGDCSIRIKKVRQTHVGRWVCSVFVSLLHQRLVSRPAAVAMATEAAFTQQPRDASLPAETEISHQLQCRTDLQADECGWALPGDVEVSLRPDTAASVLSGMPLTFTGGASGDCTLTLQRMVPALAGEWRCYFRRDQTTVWSRAALLAEAPVLAANTAHSAGVNVALIAVLVLLGVSAIAAGVGAAIYRRRSQLRHRRLLENPLYGIRNLQLAAANTSATPQKPGKTEVPPAAAGGLAVLGRWRRAAPNDYSGKATLVGHLYDSPRPGALYAVPNSSQSYQVPRSSYEIPPTPVPLSEGKPGVVDNVYEEVGPPVKGSEEVDGGYLIPDKLAL